MANSRLVKQPPCACYRADTFKRTATYLVELLSLVWRRVKCEECLRVKASLIYMYMYSDQIAD